MTVYRIRRRRPVVLATTPHCSPCRKPVLVTQDCSVCGEARCPTCYGDWHGLACQSCRTAAKAPELRVA